MSVESICLERVKREVRSHADPEKAVNLRRFFKTGKGEYAEGDVFLGIHVPLLRSLSRKFRGLSFSDTLRLLSSRYHEERFLALAVLKYRFLKAQESQRRLIYRAYLEHTRFINNWDLVDTSAPHIVGAFLWGKGKREGRLFQLARSLCLWERRIAILSTFFFIRQRDVKLTYRLAVILLKDQHDLMHKAVGWMLREAGKIDSKVLEAFLEKHYGSMPRTMLRYAIERFPKERRKLILAGDFRFRSKERGERDE